MSRGRLGLFGEVACKKLVGGREKSEMVGRRL